MIYNNPVERARFTQPWIWQDGIFTEEEIDSIVKYCDYQGVNDSAIFGSSEKEIVEKIRKSGVKFHYRDDNTAWIFDRINIAIEANNERYYRFNLNGYDAFQYTTYDKSGKYDWHMDIHLGGDPGNLEETRKLSMTICLNDEYTGGEFQVNMGQEKNAITLPAKKGRAFFFPSFVIHKVAPIKKGIRKSLVVWVTGPKFV
jgi:PKHD-type hydroxylase